jgi:hypothetical protein
LPTACICSACRFAIFPQPIMANCKSSKMKVKIEIKVKVKIEIEFRLNLSLKLILNRQNFFPFF